MKKNILFSLLAVAFTAFNGVNAQVTYAKPEEFKEIKKRTLIVQLLEESPEDIADMEKQIAKEKKAEKKTELQNELKYARAFVTDYNKYMKDAVTKFWDINAKVEYKTGKEVAALRKSKSTAYTVLYYSESSSQRKDAMGFRYFPELSIPTLNYSRMESGTVKVDYSYFMHFTGFRDENVLRYADLVLSLKMMKNHIALIEKQDKKNYTFKEYAEDQAKANCKLAKGKAVKMAKKAVHKKSTEAELKEDYKLGTLEFVSADDIDKAIENESDELIALVVPWNVMISKMGPLTTAVVTCYRIFVNAKTGQIYSISGISTGDVVDQYYRPKSARQHSDCD